MSSTAPYAPLSPLTPLPDLRLSASLGQYGEQKTARAICIYIPRPPPAPSRPPHAPFTLVQSELRHFSDEIESMRSTIAETAGMQMRIALKEQEAAEAEARASEANAQAAALKMRLRGCRWTGAGRKVRTRLLIRLPPKKSLSDRRVSLWAASAGLTAATRAESRQKVSFPFGLRSHRPSLCCSSPNLPASNVGAIGSCTKMACIEMGKPYCLGFRAVTTG